jgi:hypothetical protein
LEQVEQNLQPKPVKVATAELVYSVRFQLLAVVELAVIRQLQQVTVV